MLMLWLLDLLGFVIGAAAALTHRSSAANNIGWQRRFGYRGTERDLSRLFLWGGIFFMVISLLSLVGDLAGII
jgi:preprotein translocase subunit SecG